MVFNSIEFLLFFPIVSILYFLLPQKYRMWLLLISSCFFYAWFKIEYLFILLFTIVVDYFAALWIEKTEGLHRKWALIISIIANVGVLAVFKYADFAISTANSLLYKIGKPGFDPLEILLPIGLSFHTFQAMSYTIEVYRGKVPAEQNLFRYALYVMFYPQLVAGPIERPQNVIPQFYEHHRFDYARVVSGLRLMLWGMFKKVMIADRLAIFVEQVYDSQDYTGYPIIIATLFFGIQIYCDFSGYTDIGIGAARVMGFRLMKNFERPYYSKSISEFWSRWHISLSTWFRDYLYIPLGGNRNGKWRRYFNLLVVFLVSGLWHGASWNFVLWGALHGLYLIAGQMSQGIQHKVFSIFKSERLRQFIHILLVFGLVNFAWVFFRAKTFNQSKYLIKSTLNGSNHSINELIEIIGVQNLVLIVLSIGVLEAVQFIQRNKSISQVFEQKPAWMRQMAYALLIYGMLFYAAYSNAQFIYFQF